MDPEDLFAAFEPDETATNKHIRFSSSSESEKPNGYADIMFEDANKEEETVVNGGVVQGKSAKRKRRRKSPTKPLKQLVKVKGPISASKAHQISSLIDEYCPESRAIESFPEKLDQFVMEFVRLKSDVNNGTESDGSQDYSVFGSVTAKSGRIFASFKAPMAPERRPLAQKLIDQMDVRVFDDSDNHSSPTPVDETFVIDAEGHGGKLIADSISDTPDSNVLPNYEKVGWAAPLSSDSQPPTLEPESVGPKRMPNVCFNCSGEHTLRECPSERNHDEINKNRQEYLKNSGMSNGPKSNRYCQDNPKFAKFKAGVIGEDLRSALGLRDDELPPWIYQMRILGVPPGYIKEAVVDPLHMYDIHGNKPEGETVKEEGVIEDDDEAIKYGSVELSLVPEWPGYNVALPEGVKDDWRRLGFPPMVHENSKLELERLVSEAKSLKRKSLSRSDIGQTPVVSSSSRSKRQRTADKTPSVASQVSSVPPIEIELSSDSEVDVTTTTTKILVEMGQFIDETAVKESITIEETPEVSHISRSVSIDFGTPARMKQSCSTPSLDKFAAGIQPFAPREERPPMEGKGFKYLRKILNEAKSRLKKI